MGNDFSNIPERLRPFAMTTISGEITKETAVDFKEFLRGVKVNSKVYINIESRGGRIGSMERIIVFIEFMRRYKNCYFIAQIKEAYSAALIIAIMADERLVSRESSGLIHHPIFHGGDPDVYDKVEEIIFSYFNQRTGIDKPLYEHLFDIYLTGDQMLRYGIATKKVKSFFN